LDAKRTASQVSESDTDDMSDLSDPASLEGRLNDVETRLEEMQGRLEAMNAGIEDVGRRADDAQVMATAAAERSRGQGADDASSAVGGVTAADEKKAADAAELGRILQTLRDGAVSGENLHEILSRARDLGGLDEAVAAVEAWAAGRKTDPDARVMLGWAYTEKLLAVPDGPERGQWANKALMSYDEALRLDPSHWDAQFQKSMNLSQWPAFLGRQKDAIEGFEKLVKQQESGASEDRFAETYFQLGNTYRAAGNLEKAKEAFQRGLDRFPDSKRLKDQLDVLK
ncbi:MAG: tetratricopeptide repeat protein, partial [Planctomycetota bacterium]